MSKWQPIETAPKDGTSVLVCAPSRDPLVAWWGNCGGVQDWVWKLDSWGYLTSTDYVPTHWMPLPEPPDA